MLSEVIGGLIKSVFQSIRGYVKVKSFSARNYMTKNKFNNNQKNQNSERQDTTRWGMWSTGNCERPCQRIKNIWDIKITVIPIVTGAPGTIPKGLVKRLEDLEIRGQAGII